MKTPLLSLFLLAGCLEPPFSPHARDNAVEDIQQTLRRIQPAIAQKRAIAYLVTTVPKHLVAYDLLAGKVLWEVPADITSRLAVGRGFVAHRQGAGEIAVRETSSGALRCTHGLEAGAQFLGMAADDQVYYSQQAQNEQTRRSHLVALRAESCSEVWRDEGSGSLGAPAVHGGIVAAPFAYQNVVFLDGKSGDEVARVRAIEESITFVRATAEGLFYGGNSGVFRFDPKSATGTKAGSSFIAARFPSDQLHSFYYWDAYQPAQADYTAFDRNRLLWLPAASGSEGVTLRDAAIYLHSYRYFFAFDATLGTVRWAYVHPRVDVVGSDDVGSALLFAAADGEVGAIDARSGTVAWSRKTGLRLAGATFDASGYAIDKSQPAPPIEATLTAIVADPDARFTAIKVFAVEALAKLPGKAVTAALLKIVLAEGVAPPVQSKAAEALLHRRDTESAPLYREALGVRYDYLSDRQPRAVDVLARVSAAIVDPQAVELLGAHLLDPATPRPTLKEIAKALVVLSETKSEALRPLQDLLLSYRCDPAFTTDPASLEQAGEGLLRHGGAEGHRLVSFVAAEPRTLPRLAAYLRKALGPTVKRP